MTLRKKPQRSQPWVSVTHAMPRVVVLGMDVVSLVPPPDLASLKSLRFNQTLKGLALLLIRLAIGPLSHCDPHAFMWFATK